MYYGYISQIEAFGGLLLSPPCDMRCDNYYLAINTEVGTWKIVKSLYGLLLAYF